MNLGEWVVKEHLLEQLTLNNRKKFEKKMICTENGTTLSFVVSNPSPVRFKVDEKKVVKCNVKLCSRKQWLELDRLISTVCPPGFSYVPICNGPMVHMTVGDIDRLNSRYSKDLSNSLLFITDLMFTVSFMWVNKRTNLCGVKLTLWDLKLNECLPYLVGKNGTYPWFS